MNSHSKIRQQTQEERTSSGVAKRPTRGSGWTTSWQLLTALSAGFAALSLAVLLLYPAVEEANLISMALSSLAFGPVRGGTNDTNEEEVAAATARTQEGSPATGMPAADAGPSTSEGPAAVFRAIMFTDVVGSTEIIHRLGDSAAFDLFLNHDRIIRGALADFRGLEIDRAGDGFVSCFRSVSRAVACAIAVQRALQTFNARAAGEQIHVRIGVGAGNAVFSHDMLFGAAVNEAARVCQRAKRDQILATGVVKDRCPEERDRFVPIGPLRLRGFPNPVDVAAIVWQYDPPFGITAPRSDPPRGDPRGLARLGAAWRRLVIAAASSSVLACGTPGPTGLPDDESGQVTEACDRRLDGRDRNEDRTECPREW